MAIMVELKTVLSVDGLLQRSRLMVVRWSETTRNYVGPPEHSIQWSCGPPKYLALAYRLLAVRLTCIARPSLISQPTLNPLLRNFERPIVGSPAKYCAIFLQKNYIAQ